MAEKVETSKPDKDLSSALASLATVGDPIAVRLSNELVHLLSDQLYQSPVKAIEELVINSYDADAAHCCVYVPLPSDIETNFIAIFDDGVGMGGEGLIDLWHIGRSEKRREQIQKLRNRKQIGKFGIGKLAARTIADKLTYISKSGEQVLSVSMNFNDFAAPDDETPDAGTKNEEGDELGTGVEHTKSNGYAPIELEVKKIDDWAKFAAQSPLKEILSSIFVGKADDTWLSASGSWTIAILEDLTEKARTIRNDTLTRVLSTAMPLVSEFALLLNGAQIGSSKETYDKIVEFDIKDLPDSRLKDLTSSTGSEWTRTDVGLRSDEFQNGVTGKVFVTRSSLYGQKSDDLARSHGFFVRVRQRVINYRDPLFGLNPLTYEIFNRFQLDIEADDLDEFLKASRESVEKNTRVEHFRELLRSIFNEAFAQYEKVRRAAGTSNKEGQKTEVEPRLVDSCR